MSAYQLKIACTPARIAQLSRSGKRQKLLANLNTVRSSATAAVITVALLSGMLAAAASGLALKSPMELPKIPLGKCTPQSVLTAMERASQTRDSNITARGVRDAAALSAFAATLPMPADHPDDLRGLSSKDRAEYTKLTGRGLIDWFNHQTESWLQRDVKLIGWSVSYLEKPDQPNNVDPTGWGRRLLDDLKNKAGQIIIGTPSNVRTCNLDLALYLRQQKNQDTETMDWSILRLYARASEMEYTAYREGIIEQGAWDQDYTRKMRPYSRYDEPTMRALVEWSVLNTALPPKSAQESGSWPRSKR
jgi:hypothetical protein